MKLQNQLQLTSINHKSKLKNLDYLNISSTIEMEKQIETPSNHTCETTKQRQWLDSTPPIKGKIGESSAGKGDCKWERESE